MHQTCADFSGVKQKLSYSVICVNLINPRSSAFRRRYFPGISAKEWNDWRWQLRNSFKDLEQLERILLLSPSERTALQANRKLPMQITPYYASLLDAADSSTALRRTVVMTSEEFRKTPGEADDPLNEDGDLQAPGLVHRYPDRVLFLVTPLCPVYCRYCTRSRMVGDTAGHMLGVNQWTQAIDYIAANPGIRDVLLSGGDPLLLSDDKLEWLLSRLRAIKHVELLRIGTKVPAVLPQRVTPALARMLKKFHPFWMSVHFAHPDELTPEVAGACARLANAGIPLGSQTVLLKGINDDVPTMKRLMQGLIQLRVRPYYIYQCDPVSGTAHFRTPVNRGLEIIRGLRGHTTGYAVPTFTIDAPGGGGKVPLLPDYLDGREGDDLLLRAFDGNQYRYPDAAPSCE
jgi:lysine 2,3-aminomutase